MTRPRAGLFRRVRCIKIINPTTLKEEPTFAWVRVGKEYVVLEIFASSEDKIYLRILDDEHSPSVWDSRMFVTVNTKIPSNWTAEIDKRGVLSLRPKAWQRPGFWEDYFDNEPGAKELYDNEKAITLAEA